MQVTQEDCHFAAPEFYFTFNNNKSSKNKNILKFPIRFLIYAILTLLHATLQQYGSYHACSNTIFFNA